MKKYLKIFVISLCFVALLTVSCFATSAQTTNAVYGHYISPGDYVISENITPVEGRSISLSFSFRLVDSDYVLMNFYLSEYVLNYVNSYGDILQVFRNDSWISDDYRYITVLEGFYIYNSYDFQWWQSNLTRVSPGYDFNLFDGFLSAFTMIGQWISGAANTLTSMFWANDSLTFLGTLAISALAFAVAFLIIGLISRFLRFRG